VRRAAQNDIPSQGRPFSSPKKPFSFFSFAYCFRYDFFDQSVFNGVGAAAGAHEYGKNTQKSGKTTPPRRVGARALATFHNPPFEKLTGLQKNKPAPSY